MTQMNIIILTSSVIRRVSASLSKRFLCFILLIFSCLLCWLWKMYWQYLHWFGAGTVGVGAGTVAVGAVGVGNL